MTLCAVQDKRFLGWTVRVRPTTDAASQGFVVALIIGLEIAEMDILAAGGEEKCRDRWGNASYPHYFLSRATS